MFFDYFKIERTNAIPYGSAYFGQGAGPIHFDDLECSGSEIDLFRCKRPPIGVQDCGHSEDAGVQCGISISKYL